MGRLTIYSSYQLPKKDASAYRDLFHRRWYEHVIYTRNAILSMLANGQDANAAVARLLKNQDDIGDLLRPFYPSGRVDEIVALLKDHIQQAGDIVMAAMSSQDTSDLIAKWRQNCQAIVAALMDLNPGLKSTPLIDQWDRHLNLTISEVVFRLNKDWASDILNFDKILDNIQTISSILADGIIEQPSFEMRKASKLISQRKF